MSLACRVVRRAGLREDTRAAVLLAIAQVLRGGLKLADAPRAGGRGLLRPRMLAGADFEELLTRCQSTMEPATPRVPTHSMDIFDVACPGGFVDALIHWSELAEHEHPWGLDLQLVFPSSFDGARVLVQQLAEAIDAERAWLTGDEKRAFSRSARFGAWTLLSPSESTPKSARLEKVISRVAVWAFDGPLDSVADVHRSAVASLHDEVATLARPVQPVVEPSLALAPAPSAPRVARRHYVALQTEELPDPDEIARRTREAEPRVAIARAAAASSAASFLPPANASRSSTPVGKSAPVGPSREALDANETMMLAGPRLAAPTGSGSFRDDLAPLVIPSMTVGDYARLRAALRAHGEDDASTLRIFGITSPAVLQAVQSEFAERFKRDPKAQTEFVSLFERYLRALNAGDG